jgi:hypothetical protein
MNRPGLPRQSSFSLFPGWLTGQAARQGNSSMSLISAPELLRTPKGYPQSWQNVFEVLVSPIILIRVIGERASANSWRDKAVGKNAEPWLSPEEFQRFRDEALAVRQRMREVLEQINGVAERTWRAGREIRTSTGRVIFPLTDELNPNRYPESVLATIRKDIIDASLNFLPIPFLIMLRDAIAAEQSIMLSDETSEVRPPHSPEMPPKATPQWASVNDLAAMLKKPRSAVESFLRRYRVKYPDCFMEADSPRRNEPKYLYRIADVLPALKEHFSEKANLTDERQI